MTLGMISKGSMDEDGKVRATNRGAQNKKKKRETNVSRALVRAGLAVYR